MKADELIINDWVYLVKDYGEPKKDILKIDALDLHRISDGMLEVEPIPLTPEILEKNGFICDGWSWWYLDFRIVLSTSKGVSVVCGRQKRFEFVHELQHALRLCGIEKEIEL